MADQDPNVPSFTRGKSAPQAAAVVAEKPAPATEDPYGYRVLESKKVSTRGGVLQFNAGKILLSRAYGRAGIRDLKSAGLKMEVVQVEPEL